MCFLLCESVIVTVAYATARVWNEVVVTAHESQGITTSSVIDRKAIEHLQPSSFTDLLSLLPGGTTQLPDLTNANSIRLRQAGSGGTNYDVSAMGTLFVADGIPMNTNANMQIVKQASNGTVGDPDAGRSHVTSGVDMRSIPTDNIESVEVIRGIAPVEYGDMSSGVVLIKRKLKATPFEARFKADSYSKLLYAGKGVELGSFIVNLGVAFSRRKVGPARPDEQLQAADSIGTHARRMAGGQRAAEMAQQHRLHRIFR